MKPEKIEQKMVETLKEAIMKSGADNLTAEIMATLFFETEPICMKYLAKKINYSLPSVSLKMKFIKVHPSITLTKNPGSKKTYIYMEKDQPKMFIENLVEGFKKRHKIINQKFPDLINEYKKTAKTKKDKEKIKIAQNMLNRMEDFNKLIPTIIKKFEEIKNKKTKWRSQ